MRYRTSLIWVGEGLLEVMSRNQPMGSQHLDDATRWLVDLRLLGVRKHRGIIVAQGLSKKPGPTYDWGSFRAFYNVDRGQRLRPSIEDIYIEVANLVKGSLRPCDERSKSIDQSEASGYTIVRKSAERHAGSQCSPSAWKKSVSGLPDKKRPNLGKSVLQKETEISSWTSCWRQ